MKWTTVLLNIAALAWSSAAIAIPPFIQSYVTEEDLFITYCPDPFDDVNYAFEVRSRAHLACMEKIFFDRFGEPVTFHGFCHVTESIYYNSNDESISVAQGAKGVGENLHFIFDFATGEFKITGAFFRLTLPGIGHVVMNIGIQRVDDMGNFEAHGLYAFPEGDTAAALCGALAP